MMRKLIDENLKKSFFVFFSNYLPLQIWTLRICIHDISKTITARSFKLGKDKEIKIKIKKLCLTSRFDIDNISSVELLLRHNE